MKDGTNTPGQYRIDESILSLGMNTGASTSSRETVKLLADE